MTKLPIFLAIAASALSNPTHAASRLPDVRVSYADLHLADKGARSVLDQRISAAIKAACGVDAKVWDLPERRAAKRCIDAKQAEVAPARAAALAAYDTRAQIAAAAY